MSKHHSCEAKHNTYLHFTKKEWPAAQEALDAAFQSSDRLAQEWAMDMASPATRRQALSDNNPNKAHGLWAAAHSSDAGARQWALEHMDPQSRLNAMQDLRDNGPASAPADGTRTTSALPETTVPAPPPPPPLPVDRTQTEINQSGIAPLLYPGDPQFHGLDIPYVGKIGCTTRGSFVFGVQPLNLAHAGFEIGAENRFEAGANIPGVAGIEAATEFGVNRNGFHAGVEARPHALGDNIDFPAQFGVNIGPDTRATGKVAGTVLPFHAGLEALGGVGSGGIRARADGMTSVGQGSDQIFGVHTLGEVAVNQDSHVTAKVGGNLG